MEWQAAAVALGALVGQFIKSLSNVPTWVPQVLMLMCGVTVYVAYNPPKVDGWAFVQYLIVALISGASVNGVASIAGSAVPALKTDSR
jgi:hypothetical protein